jgi:transposase-like protein
MQKRDRKRYNREFKLEAVRRTQVRRAGGRI